MHEHIFFSSFFLSNREQRFRSLGGKFRQRYRVWTFHFRHFYCCGCVLFVVFKEGRNEELCFRAKAAVSCVKNGKK
jgi:hypothetical protein